MNVWVTAIAVMNIINMIGGKNVMSGRERRIAAMRLVWIPGRRPVIVPARIPRARARRSWSMV